MDGILQFLLIVGIIVIGVVKQFKKEAKKNAENRPAMPVPENDIAIRYLGKRHPTTAVSRT